MIPPAIEKHFVQTTHGNTAYLEAGTQEKPPVLSVHGIPASTFLWRHIPSSLQDVYISPSWEKSSSRRYPQSGALSCSHLVGTFEGM